MFVCVYINIYIHIYIYIHIIYTHVYTGDIMWKTVEDSGDYIGKIGTIPFVILQASGDEAIKYDIL